MKRPPASIVGIGAFLTEVGDENILVQNIQQSATHYGTDKGGATITIATDEEIVNNHMVCALTGERPEKLGLIIWLPNDLGAKALAKLKPKDA